MQTQTRTLIMAIAFTAAMALLLAITTPAQAQTQAVTKEHCFACFSETHATDMMRFVTARDDASFMIYINNGWCVMLKANLTVTIIKMQSVFGGGKVQFAIEGIKLWTAREMLHRYSR
jgi:hypothetical protein